MPSPPRLNRSAARGPWSASHREPRIARRLRAARRLGFGHSRGLRALVAQLPAVIPAAAAALSVSGVAALMAGRVRTGLGAEVAALALATPPLTLPRLARLPRAGLDEKLVTVASFNVLYSNGEYTAIRDTLRDLDADITVLLEVPIAAVAEIVDHPSLDTLGGHRAVLARPRYWGVAVLSRLPIVSCDPHPSARALRVVVETSSGPLALWALHPCSPTRDAETRLWQQHLEEITVLIAQDPTALLVAAGDLNATVHHRLLRRLLRSSRLALTRRALTPPTWRHPQLGWTATLDHVTARPPLAVTASGLGPASGSDHRPVWATFVLPDLAASEASDRSCPILPDAGPARS